LFKILTCLAAEHDWRLLALAAVICLFTSWVTIGLFCRARAAQGRARHVWLGLDAAAGGYGVWATHFISMLAYSPGAEAGYNLILTALSLILAVAIFGIGFAVALSALTVRAAAIGGAIVGGGIAIMHFTGMMALELPGHISWSFDLASLSIVLGCALAGMALAVAVRRDDRRHTLAGGALLVAAILSLHFIAMAATTFTFDPTRVMNALSVSPTTLASIVAGAAAVMLGMCLVAAQDDRRSAEKLRCQKLLLDDALESLSQGVCMFDADGRVILFNKRFADLMEFSTATLLGRSLHDLMTERKELGHFAGDPQQFSAQVMAEVRQGLPAPKIMTSPARQTFRIQDRPTAAGGWVATFEDITETRHAEAEIFRLARHDSLTGLANRIVFTERLSEASRCLARDGDGYAVIMLDLDGFKVINDTLGHPAGDRLLVEVAQRLRSAIRRTDVLARIGGDEFAIILDNAPNQPEVAIALALRIINTLAPPFDLDGHQASISACIGMVLAPEHGVDAEDLLKKADLALYSAKAGGRNSYRLFRPEMLESFKIQQARERELRDAIAGNEFEMFYQPVVDAKTTELRAFEALVRWRHPTKGLIAPDQFIPFAESTGLILPLGRWILQQACEDAASWPDHIEVAVNISAVQLSDGKLFEDVLAVLLETGLSPHRLELEITETSLLENQESVLATIRQLRNLGVTMALDDFGTGYSSINYLINFPFDRIKIDKSFTQGCLARADCKAVVSSVLALAQGLGIATTAEGVDAVEQLEYLRSVGVDLIQGYLFGRPAPLSELDFGDATPRVEQVA
jgi:diguanylate cyclase (GGDEF)-like protein